MRLSTVRSPLRPRSRRPAAPSRPRRRLLVTVLAALLAAAAPALADTGPDVSVWQHPGGAAINWSRVRASGASFAFVKATEGTTVTNAWFSPDWTGAAAAGVYRGAYHFARPSAAPGSAQAQAAFFAATVGDQTGAGVLPPVLDLEASGGLSPSALRAWARTFLDEVQSLTGRQPMVYTYPSFWQTAMGGTSAFGGYPLWIAHYTSAPAPLHPGWADWTFWQYSDRATLDGVRGPVDMNRFNGTSADLARLARASAPAVAELGPVGFAPGSVPAPPEQGGRYTALAPTRVLDTRTGVGGTTGPVSGGLDLVLPSSVPPDTAGVVLSVSAVAPSGPGWVRASAGADAPATTALNYASSAGASGLVVSRTDAARTLRLSVQGAPTHLVADLVGYYDTSDGPGGHYVAVAPTRVVDSRTGSGTTAGAKTGDVAVVLPGTVPAGARGAVLNVSVVDAVHNTFVQVGAAGSADRATVLNVPGSRSRTGLVVAAPGPGGALTVSVHGGPAQLVVDLLGYYDDAGTTGATYVGTAPVRVVDTRTGRSGSRSVTVTLPGSVPAGSTAVLDVSAVTPTGTGYLRVAPAGEVPTTTALNQSRGESQTGLVLTRTDASRRVTLTVTGATTDLVVDLVGHTAP